LNDRVIKTIVNWQHHRRLRDLMMMMMMMMMSPLSLYDNRNALNKQPANIDARNVGLY